jgi:2-(1,2-epoxy-1,2-dihydrophenyl)acetyl-CoA isomerase
MSQQFENLLYTKEDGVALLTFNRPAVMNALSLTMLKEIVLAIELAQSDDEVNVLVITGAGRGFCAGADVKAMALQSDDEEERLRVVQQVPRAIAGLTKPYIAAVNGAAVGGGCDIATMADVRFASDQAKFAVNHLRIAGLAIDAGYYFLTRTLGLAKALELVLSRRFFDAHEALALGYVVKVVPHDDLVNVAMDYARDIAKCAPKAVQAAKVLLHRSLSQTLEEALADVAAAKRSVRSTADGLEGPRAFVEKRSASFTGN